jgi:hypothetical protein
MKFSTVYIAVVSGFITVASASVIPAARDDAHIGDFRLYGESGCSAQNLGVWTMLESDVSKTAHAQTCHSMSGDNAWSVSLADIIGGCWRKSCHRRYTRVRIYHSME